MRVAHFLTAMTAVAMIASPALAKKEKAASSSPTTYKLDTQASQIHWKGSKAIGSSHEGNINFKSGEIVMSEKNVKSAHFNVDMNTLTNKDLAGSPEYQTKLVNHLKSEDFFNVSKHSESSFKLTSATKKSDTEYMVKGTLTMIGKTQPIEFPATVNIADDQLTAKANIKVDRTRWDLKYGSGKFFKNLGDKMINDEFELTFDIVAKK